MKARFLITHLFLADEIFVSENQKTNYTQIFAPASAVVVTDDNLPKQVLIQWFGGAINFVWTCFIDEKIVNDKRNVRVEVRLQVSFRLGKFFFIWICVIGQRIKNNERTSANLSTATATRMSCIGNATFFEKLRKD